MSAPLGVSVSGPAGVVRPNVSIVIPTLNDNEALGRLLAQIVGRGFEIVVVDGGSAQSPGPIVAPFFDAHLITAAPGRARQLRAGIDTARGDWIWMVHADSDLSARAIRRVLGLRTVGWGRFDVRLDDKHFAFRLIESMMSTRSATTSICTGDQAIVCHRQLLDAIGGMPDQPLMEDIELSKRLRRLAAPRIFREVVTTSARRWIAKGIFPTVLFMWSLRARYFFGEPADGLAARYYPDRQVARGR